MSFNLTLDMYKGLFRDKIKKGIDLNKIIYFITIVNIIIMMPLEAYFDIFNEQLIRIPLRKTRISKC